MSATERSVSRDESEMEMLPSCSMQTVRTLTPKWSATSRAVSKLSAAGIMAGLQKEEVWRN